MNRWIAAIVLSCLCIGRALAAPGSETIRADVELARSKVYPALVNILVVERYFSGGRAQRQPAGGSGVIVSPDGVVLTNFHVAGHTTRITCTLPTGEVLDAKVLLDDPLVDLSVLKLRLDNRANPRSPLPFARLGDSDRLVVGDFVLAMGNPLMLSSSLTLGVVSNTRRVFSDFTGSQLEDMELDDGERTGILTRWIQHDALILPGNSGGPLVNLRGEVVGINELGGNGVGFAIPSNLAREVLDQALHGGLRRGSLGMAVMPVGRLGLKSGALLSFLTPGSAADRAGLKPGDILETINGKPVVVRFFEEVPPLYQRMAELPIGSKATVTFQRAGEQHTASMTVEQMDRYLGDEAEFRSAGLTAQEITPPMALLRRFPNTNGVLVTGVRPGFPFETAQPAIQEGDVILSIGGTPTSSLSALRKALDENAKRDAAIRFRRDDELMVTTIKPNTDQSQEEGDELPKAWIGLRAQVMTPAVAQAMQLSDVHGFRVTEIYPGTNAAASGLRVGDVITAINGNKLDDFRPQDQQDLRRFVEDLDIGDKARLSVIRDGKPMDLSAVLEPEPVSPAKAKHSAQKELEFSVREVTPYDRLERRWSQSQTGVLVTDAALGGWASMAGLRVDDLILSIGGRPVTDTAHFDAAMAQILKKKPRVIEVFIQRGYRTHFVFIEPDWSRLGA